MTALERKFNNMLYAYIKEHGCKPNHINCLIRWNDDKVYVRNTTFLVNGGYECINDDIFFVVDNPSSLSFMLANIDFIKDDFEVPNEFYAEIDKYDCEDEYDDDWTYLHRGEDFCIVDIEKMF